MTRILTTLLMLLALAGTNVSAASAATYFGFPVGVNHAPPPPRVVYTIEPRMEHMNHTHVMVMNGDDPGYDMFQYGSWYYMNNGDYWYRANSYRGPFVAVDARQVPRQVYAVPAEHWRHNPRFGGRDRPCLHPGKDSAERDDYELSGEFSQNKFAVHPA